MVVFKGSPLVKKLYTLFYCKIICVGVGVIAKDTTIVPSIDRAPPISFLE